MQNHAISPEEKALLITNFANAYGFNVQVNGKLTSAIFHISRLTSANQ
jgi:hypothetical protein